MPLRIFDVGACNTFLVTDDQEDARKIFSEDELPIYKSIDELAAKIHHYLNNDAEREKIAQSLYKRIKLDFTYTTQLEKILSEVSKESHTTADRQPLGEELMTILWKTSLSLMHFQHFDEAVHLLSFAGKVQTEVAQKRIINALTLAVCLKLAGRNTEAESLVSNNNVLRAPYQRLINIKDYGALRTALYYLKEASFNSEGEIPNGTAQRLRCLN